MDDPQKRQTLRGAGFLVQIEDVCNLVRFEYGIAAVYFVGQRLEVCDCLILVINYAVFQMGDSLQGEGSNAQLWVDKGDLCLFGSVRRSDAKHDVLHEHGLAAPG